MDPQRLSETIAAFLPRAVRVVERAVRGSHGKAKQEAALSVLSVWCEEQLAQNAYAIFRDPRVDVATRALLDSYVAWVNTVCTVAREQP